MFYAQLSNSVCIAVSQLSGAFNHPDMIEVVQYDEALIGKHYNATSGEFFMPGAVVLPAVVITGISVDEANAARAVIAPDFTSMKLPVGSAVTIGVELHIQGHRVPGFGDEFAMPMRSTDGAMRFINIQFNDGRASFTAEMKDSKRWEVTRDLINSGLPIEAHMDFAGITITAVE